MSTEPQQSGMKTTPQIVILGAGFGGLSCAKALRQAHAKVTVIDQRNFHLFQPLLYQVATAALSLAEIAMPIRQVLRHQANTQVQLGRVEAIDRKARNIHLSKRSEPIPYDYLVVATGAVPTYFGHDDWAAFAPVLKTAEDAIAIRHRVLAAFERAEVTDDANERRRLLSFVVVGGGPTGVEMAGAIAELARAELAMRHRKLHGERAAVTLVEAGPRLLTAFPQALVAKARGSLEQLDIDIRLDSKVELCDADGIIASGKRIEARTLIWAAGVAASPAANWLGVAADTGGRVRVLPDLSLPGDENIFVIGDTARVDNPDGQAVPGIAPAAKQQGAYVGTLLINRLSGKSPPGNFRYRNYGNLATIGRKSAIVDFGWMRLSGLLGWLTWGAAHIFFLIGFRSRVMVMLSWLWSYLTTEYGARLITGDQRERQMNRKPTAPPPDA